MSFLILFENVQLKLCNLWVLMWNFFRINNAIYQLKTLFILMFDLTTIRLLLQRLMFVNENLLRLCTLLSKYFSLKFNKSWYCTPCFIYSALNTHSVLLFRNATLVVWKLSPQVIWGKLFYWRLSIFRIWEHSMGLRYTDEGNRVFSSILDIRYVSIFFRAKVRYLNFPVLLLWNKNSCTRIYHLSLNCTHTIAHNNINNYVSAQAWRT